MPRPSSLVAIVALFVSLTLSAAVSPPPGESVVPVPDDPYVNRQRGMNLIKVKEYPLAIPFLEETVRQVPTSSRALNDLGVVLWRFDDRVGARKAFEKALALNPDNDKARRNMRHLNETYMGGQGERVEEDEYEPEVWAMDGVSTRSSGRHRRTPRQVEHRVEQLPQLTLVELEDGEGKPLDNGYTKGLTMFGLQGAMDAWPHPIGSAITLEYLRENHGHEIVDYYPVGAQFQSKPDTHPYRIAMRDAIDMMLFNYSFYEPHNVGTYFHWNMLVEDVAALNVRLGGRLPSMFSRDLDALRICFDNDQSAMEDMMYAEHWTMLLVASRGAGMFMHTDYLRTSSWQAQLLGRKRWHLCYPNQTEFMYSAGDWSGFDPDYDNFPRLRDATCYQHDVREGEMFYYPADTWHQTVNIDPINIAYSASVVDHNNWRDIHEAFVGRCTRDSNTYQQTTCDILPACYERWERHFEGHAQNDEL